MSANRALMVMPLRSYFGQDEAAFFRNLAVRVRPSIVTVEDTVNNGSFCAGCVIHKTKSDTFVLTKKKKVHQPGLVVHFSEKPPKPAECLASGRYFAVLATGEVNDTCESVIWKDPVEESDTLVFVPSSTTSYEKIKCFISKASCESAAGDASPDTELEGSKDLFITLCQHKETNNMVSTPVFSKTAKANGVVLTDCICQDEHGNDGEDGYAQKICLSATGVEKDLKLMIGDDWKEALSVIHEKKAKAER